MLKRLFDIVASGLGLAVTTPLSLAAAVAIKAESPGPVIFSQERVGRDGRTFRIYKFRTMRIDLLGPLVTAGKDQRITRVGGILRKSKIDEVPQLWNVITGSMSIVGPRPEVARYVEEWPSDLRGKILSVRPGITDPATLMLRNEQEILASKIDPESYYVESLLPIKAVMYADYVDGQSFVSDLRLILGTLRAIIKR